MIFIIVYLVLINILSFILFLIDKIKAINKQNRIPESVLHFFTILGGGMGSVVAIFLLKHKKRKPDFVFLTFTFIGIQLILLYFLNDLINDY